MATFEEEYRLVEKKLKRLIKISLVGKKVKLVGEENFVREGPNIIVGNHIGSFKDVAIMFKIVPRQVFFTANKKIFDKDDLHALMRHHLKRHLKRFGLFLDLLFRPFTLPIFDFISKNIANVGTVPVDLEGTKRNAIKLCEQRVDEGRPLVLLQGRGRIISTDPNPYVHNFRRGASIICYNLYEEKKKSIPVTPVAVFKSHWPFMVPCTIRVNVGAPMFIQDYWEDDFNNTVRRFSSALENSTKELLHELLLLENHK
ncbi:MAG: 1-acyl-sn-glycerol-3-phosphate acyltransferase [Candidatus Aminicenantes bacterium]|nr:1-acyl-sn-glycerol-3-phosphate acyltransferase [Candidatus Aminicenantes bacterium]